MKAINLVLSGMLCFLLIACDTKGKDSSQSHTDRTQSVAGTESLSLLVYKTPTCGCCADWVKHLESAGMTVTVEDRPDLSQLKQSLGLSPRQQSCHTGLTEQGGYFFEGHIPAHVVKRFLQNPPAGAKGLTVPGMPMGSPGMEMGDRFDPYDVLLVNESGETEIFERVQNKESQYQ